MHQPTSPRTPEMHTSAIGATLAWNSCKKRSKSIFTHHHEKAGEGEKCLIAISFANWTFKDWGQNLFHAILFQARVI